MLSDKEVLEACITKAIEGGWKWRRFCMRPSDWADPKDITETVMSEILCYDDKREEWTDELDSAKYPAIIFNLDFARALWGEYQVCESCSYRENVGDTNDHDPHCSERSTYYPVWQYHLQQLAISEDRIAYLRRNA